jgi:RNA 3'-terminal phosphate cyclase
VWLQSEYKGKKKEDELQGYSVQLYAETISGLVATSDATFDTALNSPEEVALHACQALLYDIANMSAVDQYFQSLYILMLSFSKSAKIAVGPIQKDTMQVMRDIKLVSGVTYTIEEQETGYTLSCIGQNIKNIAFKNTVDA